MLTMRYELCLFNHNRKYVLVQYLTEFSAVKSTVHCTDLSPIMIVMVMVVVEGGGGCKFLVA